jgi:predicted ATP-dependent serine protease
MANQIKHPLHFKYCSNCGHSTPQTGGKCDRCGARNMPSPMPKLP